MKASDLPKDSQVSIRINSELKEKLKDMNISVQSIIDGFLNNKIKLNIEVKND